MKIAWVEKYLLQAEQLVYSNQVELARDLLQNLLYDEPGYAPLHNLMGWVLKYYLEEEEGAIRHWTWAIQFDPSFAPPWLHLGLLYLDRNDLAQAVAYLEQGLIKPQARKATLLDSLARAYEMKGEYRRATGAYREALVHHTGPNSAVLLEGIKRCRRKRWTAILLRPRK